MYLSIFDPVKQVEQSPVEIDAASWYCAFEHVKDGRASKGKRYPLAFIFTLILLGKLVGETTLEGIIDWITEREGELKRLLKWPKRFPCSKTYRSALSECDHHEVSRAIAQVISKARAVEQCGEEPSRLLAPTAREKETFIQTALDGKILRGTLNHDREDQPAVHLLSLYECESGIVLDQFEVEKSKNELSTSQAILHPLLVKGRIITADAMFSCRVWCATMRAYGGHYLLPIKENNPVVLRDLADFFDDPGLDRQEFEYYKEVSKGHGRLEVREIWTSTLMNDFFHKDWTDLAQVFLIRKEVKKKGEVIIKTCYGITSLPRRCADARRLLELKRKHWWIENRIHYRRDVTLGEYASQMRSQSIPQVIAAFNWRILALMDLFRLRNVAKQMMHYDAHPRDALLLLLGKLSRQSG